MGTFSISLIVQSVLNQEHYIKRVKRPLHTANRDFCWMNPIQKETRQKIEWSFSITFGREFDKYSKLWSPEHWKLPLVVGPIVSFIIYTLMEQWHHAWYAISITQCPMFSEQVCNGLLYGIWIYYFYSLVIAELRRPEGPWSRAPYPYRKAKETLESVDTQHDTTQQMTTLAQPLNLHIKSEAGCFRQSAFDNCRSINNSGLCIQWQRSKLSQVLTRNMIQNNKWIRRHQPINPQKIRREWLPAKRLLKSRLASGARSTDRSSWGNNRVAQSIYQRSSNLWCVLEQLFRKSFRNGSLPCGCRR